MGKFENGVVIGIDGGGTSTRALCADLDGRVLGYAEAGGTNPEHNSTARENVRGTIRQVIERAGREPTDVRALVAGLSGLDRPQDREWADEFTRIDGLTAPRLILNDAQVAHAGALRGKPGIVAVIGTGAMIWAITEQGRNFRDFDFGYYSAAASRYLGLAAVNRVLADLAGDGDVEFVAAIFAQMGVRSQDELRELAATYQTGPHEEHKRRYGQLAKCVTDGAMGGAPLAKAIAGHFVGNVVQAFGILGGCFAAPPVSVSVVGSVGRSAYFRREIPVRAEQMYPGRFAVVEPDLSPLAGAALLALQELRVDLNEAADRLREHPVCRLEGA